MNPASTMIHDKRGPTRHRLHVFCGGNIHPHSESGIIRSIGNGHVLDGNLCKRPSVAICWRASGELHNHFIYPFPGNFLVKWVCEGGICIRRLGDALVMLVTNRWNEAELVVGSGWSHLYVILVYGLNDG